MSGEEAYVTATVRVLRNRMGDLPTVKVGRETVVTTTILYAWLDQLLWNITASVEFRAEVSRAVEGES